MVKRKKKNAADSLIEIITAILVTIIKLVWGILSLPVKVFKEIKRSSRNSKYGTYQNAKLFRPDQSSRLPCPYKRKFLLTKKEWTFYKQLKPIADELGLAVLTKIRMADLVEPATTNDRDYYAAFGKVKAKHVDFALARPDNLYVELLIELDDNSHRPGNERDAFVEQVYRATGYTLLRLRTAQGLKEYILGAIAPNKAKPQKSTEAKSQESAEEIYQNIMKHLDAPTTEETNPTV